MNEPAPEQERLDALRRRLYAPGATEADIAAYRIAADRAAADRAAADHSEEPAQERIADAVVPEAAPAPEPVPRRRLAVLAGAVAVLLAGGIVAVIHFRPVVATTAPVRSPSAAATEGRIPTSAAARAAFLQALDSGRSPRLLDFVSGHPASPPPALHLTGRAASKEYSGHATQTIALDPPALAGRGGKVTVVVLLDGDGSFSWRAERVDQADDRSGPVVPVGSHAGSARAGEPTSATVAYTGAAPTRLAVFAAESVRWDVVVVFTD